MRGLGRIVRVCSFLGFVLLFSLEIFFLILRREVFRIVFEV